LQGLDSIRVTHNRNVGETCEYIEPNVTEDSIFYVDGEPIGFYLTKMPEKMCKLADLANAELMSERVPKSGRMGGGGKSIVNNIGKKDNGISFDVGSSVILGSTPPKAYLGRPYKSISSTHNSLSAQTFIKAMLLISRESEKLIKNLLPKQYEQQIKLFEDVPEKWRFGNLFTSSVSNCNISAPFHLDTKNIVGAVNVIICKKLNSKGGDLHIPDYNATIGQQDNSILVYPAWRNMHGVTPIIPTHKDGYRNSLIFYPLKAFVGLKD